MKRMIGLAIANWLRKRENREKAKRALKRVFGKQQSREGNPRTGRR